MEVLKPEKNDELDQSSSGKHFYFMMGPTKAKLVTKVLCGGSGS